MSEVAPAPASRRRWIAAIPLALFLALAGLFLFMLFAGDAQRLPSTLISRPAPALTLPPLPGLTRDGAPIPGFGPDDLKGDGVTVVNVFASWCVPCRDEHPLLVALAQEPGLRIVGLNYKDLPDNARRFLGALGNPYARVGVDPGGRAAIDWGVYGVPESFVVDRAGVVRHKHVGPLTPESLPRFREAIAQAARS